MFSMSTFSYFRLNVTILRTSRTCQPFSNTFGWSKQDLLILLLLVHERLQDARDDTVDLIISAAASGHLHVIRIDTLDNFDILREIEFRGIVINNLEPSVLHRNLDSILTFPSRPRTPVTPRAS